MVSDRVALIRWLSWVRQVSPELYALFKVQHPEIIQAINTSELGFWGSINWGSIAKTATDFIGKALPIYQQQKQFKQQLELAKAQANWTPPPSSVYAAQAVPTSTPTVVQPAPVTPHGQPVIEIKIEKSQLQEVNEEAQKVKAEGTNKWLIPLAIGGAMIIVATQF